MEVVGRHALLFNDDAASAFVNSRDALVEWNSLLIDRYDVRHLLSSPPPLLKRRRQSSSPSNSEEFELDQIRYEDLPPPSDDRSILQGNNGTEAADGSGYRAVSFSYGNTDVSFESNYSDIPAFFPPFSVPESLLQSLPPTEKLHQIMARTATFVSEHGGQSEIVLRVKQGNNPTFGFLMPDHHLHAYFRFLVEHPEVLKSDNNTEPGESNQADQEQKQTQVAGEALSLLGSTYESGEDEDEDGAVQIVSETKDNEPGDNINATPKHPPHTVDKEKGSLSKKIHSVSSIRSSTGFSKKKEGKTLDSLPSSLDKPQASTPPHVNEPLIVEPPLEIKSTMEKIVEFILKNGKEFEAVLVEQDRKNGRFPFLLPSNLYHPYYLKSIQRAQESKQAGKSSTGHKHDLEEHASGKRSSSSSNGTTSHDLPWDSDRKEKFKMVINGSKKETQEAAPKSTQEQSGMSVDAAAAILEAATRGGMKNPKLDIPIKSDGDPSVSSPVAKTAALAAASEADSCEAGLTKEQKQKAERLKRAKMFAAIIKSGAVPHGGREREGSSGTVPVERKRHHHSRSKRVEEEEDESRHGRKRHHSSRHHSRGDESRHSRKRHLSSKDRESRPRHKYHSSSEDESGSYKPSGGKAEVSVSVTGKNNSRETSLGLINDRWEGSVQVKLAPSDELKAKVRAMLLATM